MADASDDARHGSNAVKVLVRVRPLLPRELAQPVCISACQGGVVELNKGSHTFKSKYETIFPDSTTQEGVYAKLRPAVHSAFDGYNTTILAYGQTGTGKTYTMMGPHAVSTPEELQQVGEQHGIIPRAICEIFARRDALRHARQQASVTIICSYMEIYNDSLYDLLQPYKQHLSQRHQLDVRQPRSGLAVKEDGYGQTCVQHVMAVRVTEPEEVFRLIRQGNDQRSMRQTELNQHSSRGHSILQLLLEQRSPSSDESTVMRSKVNFVDLAGSERFPADASSKARVTETNAINVSLSSLAGVVSALVAKDKHVPYRDSKLTHLLKDSLGGNCNTYVIATISPSAKSFEENVSTLKFADRASSITNNAVQNVQLDLKALLEMKDREIRRLRAMVTAFADKHGTPSTDKPRNSEDESHVRSLKGQIEQLQGALDVERRRAQELEGRMHGVTVVEAPELLSADSDRRASSLSGSAAGPSTPTEQRARPGRQDVNGRPAHGRHHTQAHDDVDWSQYTLGPDPHAIPRPGSAKRPTSGRALRPDIARIYGAAALAMPGQKRRPQPRSRHRGAQLQHQLVNPHSVAAPPLLSERAIATPSVPDQTYQTLVNMYSKLASQVAELQSSTASLRLRDVPDEKRMQRDESKQLDTGSISLADLAARQGGIRAPSAKANGWGLRNIIIGTESSPSAVTAPAQLPSASVPTTSGSSVPLRSPADGFGLKAILQTPAAQSASSTGPGRPMKGRRKAHDVFDTGSWIYILGASQNSLKAKQIAKSAKMDSRKGGLTVSSVDLKLMQRH